MSQGSKNTFSEWLEDRSGLPLNKNFFKTLAALLSKLLEFILLYILSIIWGSYCIWLYHFSYTIWHYLCLYILISTRQKFFLLYFNLSVSFFPRQRKCCPCMVIIYWGWENGGCEDEPQHLTFFHLRENLWKYNWAILRQNDQWAFRVSN